ncbi:maleylacetoacetate isomerase [Proteobacteria bacterium 005FR1]|nr:maleylacetoacetate isomerase [Proteobacteria bacterium 005FR1]
MKLYSYFRSSAAFRVRIALNLKGLDFETVPVNLIQSKQREDAYLERSPQGLVPTLELDSGESLVQSLAICEYLEEQYPEPPLLPRGALARARVRALTQVIACDIHPLNNLRVLKYIAEQQTDGEEKKLEWYRHWVHTGFQALDRMLAASNDTGDFCHGDEPTLADVVLVPQVFNARRYDCDLTSYPNITRISANCEALPAFIEAEPARQPDAPA